MDSFISFRNFILAVACLVGVILFVLTCIHVVNKAQGTSSKNYTSGQLLIMYIISVCLCSMVTFLDMGSVTVFQSNAYTVYAVDEWLDQSNLANVFAQMGLVGKDIDLAAQVMSFLLMAVKLTGLCVFAWCLGKWYGYAQGTASVTATKIVLYFFAAIALWNIGAVIHLIANQFDYNIVI